MKEKKKKDQIKMTGVEEHVLIFSSQSKSSIGIYWKPTKIKKKHTLYPRTMEKPQQNGKRENNYDKIKSMHAG